MEPPKDATQLYSRVFHALTLEWSSAQGFRRVTALGRDSASQRVEEASAVFARTLANTDQFDRFFKDKAGVLSLAGGVEGMARSIADAELARAAQAIDAAALLFAHSLLDAAVSDLCEVCYLVAPRDWTTFVSSRKVTIGEVSTAGFEAALDGVARSELTALRREALSKRVDRLFALCRPSREAALLGRFQFDSARLSALDLVRQRIVHGEGIAAAPSTVTDDVEFLQKSGLFLFSMVNAKYDVSVDPLLAIGFAPSVVAQMHAAARGAPKESA